MRLLAGCVVLAVVCVSAPRAGDPIAAQQGIVDLGTLGGPFSSASAINNRGHIVGVSNTDLVTLHAFLWQDGTMIDLGTLPGGHFSGASGINDRGQVVGASGNAAFESRAVLWDDGAVIDLGALPGSVNCTATAISRHTHIVGSCDGAGAFLW
jgi:probable HAF family extracellular repeat protein